MKCHEKATFPLRRRGTNSKISIFVYIPNAGKCLTNLISVMNIFVAKLNFKTKTEDLEAAFAQFGTVSSCKIVRDKETGRSKGYGFVEMPNDEEAQRAIDALNEKELDGRVVAVKPANPRPGSDQ